jgi:heme-degrading monooxygenase HmoA
MIRRSWHGAVPNPFADAFQHHFRDEIEGTPGNLGVFLRRVADGNLDHFFLLTYWDTWTSIREFAGATPHVAVTYPSDAAYGLISDTSCSTWSVRASSRDLGKGSGIQMADDSVRSRVARWRRLRDVDNGYRINLEQIFWP